MRKAASRDRSGIPLGYGIWGRLDYNRYALPPSDSTMDVIWLLGNQTFWIAVQAVGTIAAFFVILAQLRKAQAQIKVMQEQTQAINATTAWDLLLRLDDRFNSPDMRLARGQAAHILKAATKPSERMANFWAGGHRGLRVQNVLDIFEVIGLFLKKSAIDAQAVWTLFSHYIVNYYFYCEQAHYFKEWLGDDPSFYEEFKALHARMQEIRRDDPDVSFLDEEIKFLPVTKRMLAP